MEMLGLLSAPLWLLALPVAVILLLVYIKWHHGIFRQLAIPGPDPGLLGVLSQYGKKGLFGVDCDLVKQFGHVVGVFHGRRPWLLVADPEMVKQICIKEFSSFTNRFIALPVPDEVLQGVTMIEDEHWHFSRSILSAGFSSGRMRQMVPLIQQNAENLKQNIAVKCAKKESIEMKDLFGAFTMDVIASTGFGIIIDSQKNPNDPFVANAKKVMSFKFGFLFFFNELLPGVSAFMHAFGLSFVEEEGLQFFYSVGRKAMKGQDRGRQGMPDVEVTANSMVLLTAAYDTTSNLLTFLTYELALNPDIQDRLVQEIRETIGQELATYDNVWNLPYLDAVISETLRKYPPAIRYNRRCDADVTIKGYRFTKGLEVNIAVYAMHHDPDLFPDPDKFDPDRFLPENRASIPEYAWIPFGAGPRHCLGMRLALLECKMALVTVLQHFRLQTGPDTKIPVELEKSTGFCKAAHPVYLRFEPRN